MYVKQFAKSSFGGIPTELRNKLSNDFGNDYPSLVEGFLGNPCVQYWVALSEGDPISFTRYIPGAWRNYQGNGEVSVSTDVLAIAILVPVQMYLAPEVRIWTSSECSDCAEAKTLLRSTVISHFEDWVSSMRVVSNR
jgi:hypothetical protein